MRQIIEHLKSVKHRESTRKNYLAVWRKFNEFVIQLDARPKFWEDRASLFGAYMVSRGIQSSTLRSYMSAIKGTLVDAGYAWDDNRLLLSTLIRGCRVINDKVRTRLPIQIGLLEILLFELKRLYHAQPYLEVLYQTIFITCYYGLLQIGEATFSPHCLLAKDVHISDFKDKILFILHSSKTHGKNNKAQRIRISASEDAVEAAGNNYYKYNRHFCPFELSRRYQELRGGYIEDTDKYYVFSDESPVRSEHVRRVLRKTVASMGLNPLLYNTHSFCAGRALDLLTKFGKNLDYVKFAGRWKSNTVYKYVTEM